MSQNPYARLIGLLPKRPLLVGEVVDYADGAAVIRMPGGGKDTARGSAIVGQRVYFRDGLIEGPAPLLPVELIEV